MKCKEIIFIFLVLMICSISVNADEDKMFDLTAPPKTDIEITEDLYFGANIEVEFIHEDNFDLDDADKENETSLETSLSLALSYEPTEDFQMFLNLEPSYFDIDDENNRKKSREQLELVQGFFEFRDLIGESELVIGRQRFMDEREWIYDEEMEGVRYVQYFEKFALDMSVSKKNRQDLLSDDPNEDAVNFMGHAQLAINDDNKAGFYIFSKQDYSSADEDPMIYGVQAYGELTKQIPYWLNMAYVGGTAGNKDIRAYGGDIGLTFISDAPLEPSLTLAYAYGSGDKNALDGKDESFRQTGFQDNDARLNGVTRVKTYGELVDPELSNLSIYTAGFGIRPHKTFSVDFLGHYYKQNEISTQLRDTEIDTDPNGVDDDIGREADVVLGWKIKDHLKSSIAFGYFWPGDAFGSRADHAKFVEAEIKIGF